MAFQAPLDSGQLIAHRGSASVDPSYEGRTFISVNANDVVYSARINQATFGAPALELTYDGGSGTLADVVIGMTVLISHTNDQRAAFFRGRIRKDPTSTILYINETGAAFADNDWIFVLADFDVHIKLIRWGGQVLLDGEDPFDGLPPLISNLQAVYVDEVDPISEVLELTLTPTVDAAESGATISSYLWTIPTGGTITSGSTTTKDIVVEFDPGEYWIHFTATDSEDNALTRHIKVWAHDANNPPTLLDVANLSISSEVPIDPSDGASEGYSATFDAFSGIADVLPRTLAVIWTRERYNDEAGSIFNNILQVGRLRSETDDTTYSEDGQDSVASMVLEGPLAILSSIKTPSIEMDDGTGDSDVVLIITNLTIWRGFWMVLSRCSTFGEVYPVSFDDISDTYRCEYLVTNGSELLAASGDLGQSIVACLQMAPDGRCELDQRGVMLDDTGRDALDTIVDFDKRDVVEHMAFAHEYRPSTARVVADGGAFNGGSPSAYVAEAPPGAPDDAPGDTTLSRQILSAGQTTEEEKAELTERAGNALAAAQPPQTLTITMAPGYRWLTPAVDQWFTWDLDGSEFVNGLVVDNTVRWWLQGIRLEANPQDGTIDVEATFVRETSGAAGGIVPYSTVDTGAFGDLGDLGEILELPPIETSIEDFDFTASDGGFNVIWGSYVPATGFESDCVDGVQLVDISKDFGQVRTVKRVTVTYDATYTGGMTNRNRIWVRASSSAAWFEVKRWTTVSGTANQVIANVPNLAVSQVRVAAYAGNDCLGTLTITAIEIESVGEEPWTVTIDFADGQQGWYLANIGGEDYGQWLGDKWGSVVVPTVNQVQCYILRDFATPFHLLEVRFTANIDMTGVSTVSAGSRAFVDTVPSAAQYFTTPFSGDLTFEFDYDQMVSQIGVITGRGTDYSPGDFSNILSVTITGIGPIPPELM